MAAPAVSLHVFPPPIHIQNSSIVANRYWDVSGVTTRRNLWGENPGVPHTKALQIAMGHGHDMNIAMSMSMTAQNRRTWQNQQSWFAIQRFGAVRRELTFPRAVETLRWDRRVLRHDIATFILVFRRWAERAGSPYLTWWIWTICVILRTHMVRILFPGLLVTHGYQHSSDQVSNSLEPWGI